MLFNKKQPEPRKIVWHCPGGKYQPLLYDDILNQAHVLIAGTTGAGKSVLINSLMYNALFDAPSEKMFILIDPKKTELYPYRNLPHTIAYYDTPEAAVTGLQAALDLIDKRMVSARKQGQRSYNGAAVYIIIDELGDLAFSDKRAVKLLSQIAMIGRAANVHIIGATQCPNRKTLPAEIVANCPARIGLRCRDRIESRQIIGAAGAEDLPRYGHGIYISPERMEPELIAIPYTDEALLQWIIDFWMQQKAQNTTSPLGRNPYLR